MPLFERALAITLGAVLLFEFGRRIGTPYPALRALGGAALAFVPGAPTLRINRPDILALFVAPVFAGRRLHIVAGPAALASHPKSLSKSRQHWFK
jgi:hypothetical protein